MRTRSRLVSFLAALALLAGCAMTEAEAAAATVADTTISRGEVSEHVARLVDTAPGDERSDVAEATGNAQRLVLTILIRGRIIERLASDRGVEIDQAEVEAAYQSEVDNAGGEEPLAELLRPQGLTPELYRDVILPLELRMAALRESVVGAAELPTRTARHILVGSEDEANEIIAELEDGADFAELAEERSEDPGSAMRGGELSPQPQGAFLPEFDAAVWNAELGEIVGPVETQAGFHVLEVIEEGELDVADADPQLIERVAGTEFQEMLLTAVDEADVSVAAGLGRWEPELAEVVVTDRVGAGRGAGPPGMDELPGEDGLGQPEDE